MKKTLSIILSLLMIISMLSAMPFSAFAETYSGKCGASVNYSLDTETGVLTISGSGRMNDFYINDPGYYAYRSYIKSVVINNGVTYIGYDAFLQPYYQHLKSVTIPDSVTEIGSYAFGDAWIIDVYYGGTKAQWDMVYIQTGNTDLTKEAFIHCSDGDIIPVCEETEGICGDNTTWELNLLTRTLTISGTGATNDYVGTPIYSYGFNREVVNTVVVESGITRIGNSMFNGFDNVKSIYLPATVTEIGKQACNGESISDVYYSGTKAQWKNVSIDTYNATLEYATVHCSDGIAENSYSGTCGDNVNWYFDRGEGVLTISGSGSTYDYDYGSNPEYLPRFNTYKKNISSVVVENGVTRLGDGLFKSFYCTSVTLPASVTEIGDSVFGWCINLKDVYYSGTASQWEAISIGNSNTELTDAFIHCSDGTASATTGSCGASATFSLDVETGVLTISGSGEMDNVNASDSPYYKFRDIITSVVIESGITRIGSCAFYGLENLTSITVENSECVFSDYAVDGCSNLTDVYFSGTKEQWSAFYNEEYNDELKTATIHCSNGDIHNEAGYCGVDTDYFLDTVSKTLYISGHGGMDDYDSGESPFYNRTDIEKINIFSGVNHIGDYAFEGCTNISEIEYSGTIAEWNSVTIGTGNDVLYDCPITCFDGVTGLSDGSCGENVTYHLDRSTGVITLSGTGSTYDYAIRTSIFYNNMDIQAVVIEEGVTRIGAYLFHNCDNIKSVTFTSSITEIGSNAFRDCDGLTDVTLPDNITCINTFTFYNCSGLTRVSIPAGVTDINYDAFVGCKSLKNVYYSGTMAQWEDISIDVSNSNLYNAFIHCSDGSLGIETGSCGYEATYSLDYSTGELTISGYGDMYDYEYDESPFFENSAITSITVSDGVTSIGDYAFYCCDNLTAVALPTGITKIGDWAFSSCFRLSEFEFKNGLVSIGEEAFAYTGLTSVAIPDSVKTIADGAFTACYELTTLSIGRGLESLDDSAFLEDSEIASITVDSSNKKYNSRNSCNAIMETATDTLVLGCKNTVIPKTTKVIGNRAFAYINLSRVTIPNGVTTIGEAAFDDNMLLDTIDIPISVTSIGDYAFNQCRNLKTVNYSGASEDWNAITIGIYNTYLTRAKINYSATLSCGDNAEYTMDYSSGTLTISGSGAIYDYASGESPFYGDSAIKTVVFSAGITSIGDNVFEDCEGITDVYYLGEEDDWWTVLIGSNNDILYDATLHRTYEDVCGPSVSFRLDIVTGELVISGTGEMYGYPALDDSPFSADGDIKTVVIESGVTSIGYGVFAGCGNVTSIVIPKTVTSIGQFAFLGCNSLTDVYYNGTAESWSGVSIGSSNAALTAATLHTLPFDPEALVEAIGSAYSHTKAEYTAESLEALYLLAAQAEALLKDDTATQTQCDELVAQILLAIDNLDSLENYSIVSMVNGIVTLEDASENTTTLRFTDFINSKCDALDVVSDGIINAKDYAYLLKKF